MCVIKRWGWKGRETSQELGEPPGYKNTEQVQFYHNVTIRHYCRIFCLFFRVIRLTLSFVLYARRLSLFPFYLLLFLSAFSFPSSFIFIYLFIYFFLPSALYFFFISPYFSHPLFISSLLSFYHLCLLEKMGREVLLTHLEHCCKLCASQWAFNSLVIRVRYDASAQELLTAVKSRRCCEIKIVTLINFDISVNSKFLDCDTERTVNGYQRGYILIS